MKFEYTQIPTPFFIRFTLKMYVQPSFVIYNEKKRKKRNETKRMDKNHV